MNIIIEGPDGGGKSTLAAFIAKALEWKIIASIGPTKSVEEFRQRTAGILRHDKIVFDRHPLVSECIYGSIRGSVMIDPDAEDYFYECGVNVIVYYRHSHPLTNHRLKAHDKPDHIAMVQENHERICALYDAWALEHAHLIFRRDECKSDFLKLLQGRIS